MVAVFMVMVMVVMFGHLQSSFTEIGYGIYKRSTPTSYETGAKYTLSKQNGFFVFGIAIVVARASRPCLAFPRAGRPCHFVVAWASRPCLAFPRAGRTCHNAAIHIAEAFSCTCSHPSVTIGKFLPQAQSEFPMRALLIGCLTLTILGITLFLSAGSRVGVTTIDISLLDDKSGKPIGGIIRVLDDNKKPVMLSGLYDRLKGLSKKTPGRGWHVVPVKGGKITLTRGKYTFEAISGLETAVARQDLSVPVDSGPVKLRLPFLFRPESRKLVAGNTHLHLRNMTLPQAGEYVETIPSADRLKVLFLSYLERHKDDESYITNRYPIGPLEEFNATGVLVNNGEEHRHNFKGFGQGYGHVMFLNIKKRIDPASIGPGIMAKGFDDQPLRVGIDDARKQGGTVIWCHNTFGYEDVLNVLTGRLHALNVFDGSRRDKYADTYYRYLNIGVHMPISTGTDWFMYDFSRVYAKVPGQLTIPSWLEAVKSGHCQATNGPLLSLKVNGKTIGEVVQLKKAGMLTVEADAIGRDDFSVLQIIHNGKVIAAEKTKRFDGGYSARIKKTLRTEEPGWFAVRIDSNNTNAFEKQLYAHSSPVYVRVNGKDRFDVDAARTLLNMVEEGRAAIASQGTFSAKSKRNTVLALYDAGIRDLNERINRTKAP